MKTNVFLNTIEKRIEQDNKINKTVNSFQLWNRDRNVFVGFESWQWLSSYFRGTFAIVQVLLD